MSMPLNQLLALCGQVSAETVDALSREMQAQLAQGPDEALKPALKNASIPLINSFIQQGRLSDCLQLIHALQAHTEAPELTQLRAELGQHLAKATLRQTSQQALAVSGQLISGLSRPLKAADYQLESDIALPCRIALVMQGPVLHELSFTLETLKIYSQLYPTLDLVLSTWEDEDLGAIEAAQLPRLHIVRNAKPSVPGPSNINFQITSAKQGLVYAIEHLQPDYLLKTRTDMRMYNPNFLLDMLALLDGFAARPEHGQAQRLLIISDVVKYMMYAVPDKNMFGSAREMWRYWDQPLDARAAAKLSGGNSMRSFSQEAPAEVYLLRNYLSKLGWPLAETLGDHFNVLRDLFVVYDRAAADLYWHKYAYHLEYRFKHYAFNQILEEFGFNDWLRLQSSRLRLCDSEAIANAPSNKPITPWIQAHKSSPGA